MDPDVGEPCRLANSIPGFPRLDKVSGLAFARKDELMMAKAWQGFEHFGRGRRQRQKMRSAGFCRRNPPSQCLEVNVAPPRAEQFIFSSPKKQAQNEIGTPIWACLVDQ